ncbi:hypothetical protein I3271_07245 [Photobacterium leiognathi]|uniref:hypothetical protein n=1 Tax=Photobacterium leiognathi TaxID=553611 RepID=UPI001EDDE310|nr:hypothetical protein [Photobacterium leiognathi]MCG3884481.1 hypothetical protein [Photobacterium leiognathi]
MIHCKSQIFLSDNHCPDCGDTIIEHQQTKTAAEVLEDNSFSEYNTFTGEIVELIYHKKLRNRDYKAALWFVTVQCPDKKRGFNITADAEGIVNLKKGDVITYSTYNYEILPTFEKETVDSRVLNLIYLEEIVIHGQDHTYLSPSECPIPKKPARTSDSYVIAAGISFILAALVVIWDKLNYGIGLDGFVLNTLILGFAGWAVGIKLIKNSRKKEDEAYLSLKQEYEVMYSQLKRSASLTLNDLGYGFKVRTVFDDDVICESCNSRAPGEALYCVHCGTRQIDEPSNNIITVNPIDDNPIDDNSIDDNSIDDNPIANQLSNTSNDPIPVKVDATIIPTKTKMNFVETVKNKMNEFAHSYSGTAIGGHYIGSDEDLDVETWCYMAQIVDKNASVKTSKSYRYETYEEERDNVIHRTHCKIAQYDSSLFTNVTLKTTSDQLVNISVPTNLSVQADIGDIIYLEGARTTDKNGKNRYFNPIFMNIQKDKRYSWSDDEEFYLHRVINKKERFAEWLMLKVCVGLVWFTPLILLAAPILPFIDDPRYGRFSELIGINYSTWLDIPISFVLAILFAFVTFTLNGKLINRALDRQTADHDKAYDAIFDIREKVISEIHDLTDLFSKINK